MSDDLMSFVAELKQALQTQPGRDGRESARQLLEQALGRPDFVNSVLTPSRTAEREVVYQDEELKFCVCAHVYQGAKTSLPHDHGPTWAIYGQAEGETEMSDWRLVEPAIDGKPARAEKTKTYRMQPGDAHLYDIGDVHSPRRDAPTKLIRIEGEDTEKIQRTPIQAVE